MDLFKDVNVKHETSKAIVWGKYQESVGKSWDRYFAPSARQ